MGTPNPNQREKLVTSIIYAPEVEVGALLAELESAWGPIEYLGQELAFDHTDYYTVEMGSGLRRRIVAFQRFIEPSDLPAIKLASNEMEDGHRDTQRKRRVNMDPGVLAADKLVLATTKNFSHRIYLGRGIFADLTLLYRDGAYNPLEWTYPDYASEEIRTVFGIIRRAMMIKRRLDPSQSAGSAGET